MEISILNTKTVPTIKINTLNKTIIFHSKYNPVNEANNWCKNALKTIDKKNSIIIVGLGAGYHIKALAEAVPEIMVTVVEFNEYFFEWFNHSRFFDEISHFKNVSIKLFSNMTFTEQQNIFSQVTSGNLLIHKSGLDILPQKYSNIKIILDDILLQQNSIRNQIDIMISNFNKNILLKDDGISKLKNTYKNKPMILVSAGPSLDKQLPLLKKIRNNDNFVIGTVGTAVKPLLKYHIIPDFFVIIDPNPGTSEQLSHVELKNTPLFYLSTAFHETILLHKGPRNILWQKGFKEAEVIAEKKGEHTISTGGSVATALLDLMVYLGGTSIALIGQDLAFTDGKSHASGAHAEKKITQTDKSTMVLNYYKTGKINTAKNLNIYRKWFGDYAKENPQLKLYNCTEGGAYINNWIHISLSDYYSKYA